MNEKQLEKAKKRVEKMTKLSEYFNQDFDEKDYDEDLLTLNLRANEFYSKVIKEYLETEVVIKFNTLRHIKEMSSGFENRVDMNNFIINAINELKKEKTRTSVQDIELETLIEFKELVLNGKGKEYDITKGFDFKYSEQTIVFDPIGKK